MRYFLAEHAVTHSFCPVRCTRGWTYSGTFVFPVTYYWFFVLILICNAIWSPGMLCSGRATQSVNWGSGLTKGWNRGGWGLVLSLGWAPGRSSSSGWLPPVFQCCEKEKVWEKGKKKAKEIKKKKRETHAMGFIKSMEKRGEPNGKMIN